MILSPSMMCADFSNLDAEVSMLEHAGVDMFHMDIMDGEFVPNFGMGLQDYEFIAKKAKRPVDVHMMVNNPGRYIELFANLGASLIYIHPEADRHPAKTIDQIHQLNKKAGIAIDPDTSVETVKELLPLVDAVLIMTVNPGFAGQKFLDFVFPKIKQVAQLKDHRAFLLGVDGAISPEKIEELSLLGVDNFVLGTSALFGKQSSYEKIIKSLRELESNNKN
ncbi:ribulose-phosphate 3-epimerase [Ligilactobacillus pobuzihii]|uniref:Ribulose-phosphate 3-epimerase n=1 Tax=Ligilactobacillus pobuzihii TaxID=449659 RepID=A0A0R2LEF1_9LACO|nr:ribulose-phosphate 3-epimerase [Ligilactobacillus pobuzihii]KRK08935.1 ribulose-phosphate 3-epimerase [Ligilactobacillus pobuzihii E100301 = KCTC 13174]KRN99809.1 ribulose-phosphate 3-epimerase [Ligilactobacillus pobuzihii]GEN49227.1 ribulose-phosphate 3-epimerase [Ligilactobacillus pobuzihii]